MIGLPGRQARAALEIARAIARSAADEIHDGTLLETVRRSRAQGTLAFAAEPTFGELLACRAQQDPEQVFLRWQGREITLGELDAAVNAVAAGVAALDLGPGAPVAIVSENCPAFLEAFFAVQKLGLAAVPVNTALVGDGLAHVLAHSGARAAFVHASSLDAVAAVRARAPELRQVLSIDAGGGGGSLEGMREANRGAAAPSAPPDPEAVGLLMYTSGTTGAPKAVVYRYADSATKRMRVLAHLLYRPDDVLFTCLPLFHANALLLTTIQALNARAGMVLARRFSARRFWGEVARSGATSFHALGAMIPMLLEQPPGPDDRAHRVRVVVSSACPAAAWRPFEERFGVRIVEAYGAVDGGGFITLNLGNAPVGSIGRPIGGVRYRLVDEAGRDVPEGEVGELVVQAGGRGARPVEYFRDEAATREKNRGGEVRTGDRMWRDPRGNLYFAGRTTDSMRRRGENVSAFEIESVLDRHPDVLESAAFGVPSRLGEEEIMAVVVPIEGRRLEPRALHAWLDGKLARHAIPRFLEIAPALPKTGTHRVQKSALRERGPTAATYDAERDPTASAQARRPG